MRIHLSFLLLLVINLSFLFPGIALARGGCGRSGGRGGDPGYGCEGVEGFDGMFYLSVMPTLGLILHFCLY